MDETTIVEAPSKPPQRFRRTRIAVSVLFGVVTLALVLLWVRSYWWMDRIRGPWSQSGTTNVWSSEGHLTIGVNLQRKSGWSFLARPYPENWPYRPPQWGWNSNPLGFTLAFPHWPQIVAFASVSAFPWLSWRFSLRTLLIATTLVAVVLGLAVWAGR